MNLPDVLKSRTLLWMTDYVFHEPTIDALLKDISTFLQFFVDFICDLHPVKCVLLKKLYRCCERILPVEGIKHDCLKIGGLLGMAASTTGRYFQAIHLWHALALFFRSHLSRISERSEQFSGRCIRQCWESHTTDYFKIESFLTWEEKI